MTPPDQMTDEDFERHALELLKRELGIDGLIRFIRLNLAGKSDYTRDRLEWQKDWTVEGIVASLKKES